MNKTLFIMLIVVLPALLAQEVSSLVDLSAREVARTITKNLDDAVAQGNYQAAFGNALVQSEVLSAELRSLVAQKIAMNNQLPVLPILEIVVPSHNSHGYVKSAGFSSDSTKVVLGFDRGEIQVWNIATGVQEFQFYCRCSVSSVAFSPDGTRIVLGSEDGAIQVWDAASRNRLLEWNGHTTHVRSVEFSPDGSKIASWSYSDARLRIWDAATGNQLQVCADSPMAVSSVVFSPDGTRVVSGHYSGSIRVWSVDTGELLLIRNSGSDSAVVGFSPDGTKIVSGDGYGLVYLWDARTGSNLFCEDSGGGQVQSIKFSLDGTKIIGKGSYKVWGLDAITGTQLFARAVDERDIFSEFSPDAQKIVLVPNMEGRGEIMFRPQRDQVVRVYDVYYQIPFKQVVWLYLYQKAKDSGSVNDELRAWFKSVLPDVRCEQITLEQQKCLTPFELDQLNALVDKL